MRVDYKLLDKYNIRVDDGITYVKRFPLVTTETNDMDDEIWMEDLSPNVDYNIKDGDTIVISPFFRSPEDDLYIFFVSIEGDKSGTMGIFMPLEDYPSDSYDMFVYVGKRIATALKNEGYRNISIELDFIMNYGECVRYLEYCSSLGDEKKAITYTCEKNLLNSIFCENKLKEDDILIRFRPQDLEVIARNINKISKQLNSGGFGRADSYIKGFVYLNKDMEYEPMHCGSVASNSRYTTSCPSKGLYLCVDSNVIDNQFVYPNDFMYYVDCCVKEFGIELLVCTGDLKWTEDDAEIDKCGTFIKTRDVFDVILSEIAVSEYKYKANYDMNSDRVFEEVFKGKGMDTLAFGDVLIRSSNDDIIEMYEKLDDIRKCLEGSHLFVKGFICANEYIETVIDSELYNGADIHNLYEEYIEEETLYLVLGDKCEHRTSYSVIKNIDNLLYSKIMFTVASHYGDSESFNVAGLVEYLEYPYS